MLNLGNSALKEAESKKERGNMSLREKKEAEPSKEEIREAERKEWLEQRQLLAVRENEPIKDVYRVTVAVDVVVGTTDEARAAVKGLKGAGIFVYGIKGVRRLEPLFSTSEAFKSVSKRAKEAK